MHNLEEIKLLDLFSKSLEDHCLSRKERSTLNETLKNLTLSEHEKNVVRSKVFDLARAQMTADNYPLITLWLEEVAKLLIRNHTASVPSHTSVYFSPGEECRQAICGFIRSATATLRICVFTISDNAISKEILAAHKRGVSVKVITDNDKQFDNGSDIHHLKSQGVTVRCDETSAHMHHKFAVADTKSILTGSYNWTRSAATSNQENCLISYEDSAVAAYTKEFKKLWTQFK